MKTVLKPFNLKSLHNRDKVVVVANDQILYSEVRVVCIDRLAFYSVIVLAKKSSDSFEHLFTFSEEGKDSRNRELRIEIQEFEKGDFIFDTYNSTISIFDDIYDDGGACMFFTYKAMASVTRIMGIDGMSIIYNSLYYLDEHLRLATEEERQELLELLKNDGKMYNSNEKCIENIPIEEEFK